MPANGPPARDAREKGARVHRGSRATERSVSVYSMLTGGLGAGLGHLSVHSLADGACTHLEQVSGRRPGMGGNEFRRPRPSRGTQRPPPGAICGAEAWGARDVQGSNNQPHEGDLDQRGRSSRGPRDPRASLLRRKRGGRVPWNPRIYRGELLWVPRAPGRGPYSCILRLRGRL